MKKKCAVPVPKGYVNPSQPLAQYFAQAKGHTVGKTQPVPGNQTTALGKQASLMASAYHMTHPTVCHYMPGQRHTPNPQRGRPRSRALIVQPTSTRWAYIEWRAGASAGGPFTAIGFCPNQTGFQNVKVYIFHTLDVSALFAWANVLGTPDSVDGFGSATWALTRARNTAVLEYFNQIARKTICVPPATIILPSDFPEPGLQFDNWT